MSGGILRHALVLCCAILVVKSRWVQIPDEDNTPDRHHHQQKDDDFLDDSHSKYVVRDHKIIRNTGDFRDDGPPDHTKAAQMARYVVHNAEYVAMGTISTVPQIAGYPFVNVLSTADGPRGKGKGYSTGTPYFFTTKLDFSAQDLDKDNRLTIMISLAYQGYCQAHDLDAEDPRCARIMLSGKLVRVEKGTDEYEFAYKSFVERHPIAKTWPDDHNFFLAKLKIANVAVLDWFGGPKYIPLDVYYKTDPYDGSDEGSEHNLFSEEQNDLESYDSANVDSRRYVSMMG